MEVYGTKPKRFTKEWWGYFWDYYKWHTIAGAAITAMIAYSCVECATAVKYDLQVDYISQNPIMTETQNALIELVETNIDDVNENERVDAFVTAINMAETNDMQMLQATQTKVMLEQAYSESFVFLLSKTYADNFTDAGTLSACSEWAGGAEGNYISLAGCKPLEEIGIDTSDLYLGVRDLRKDELDDDRQLAKRENGIKLAQYLLQSR